MRNTVLLAAAEEVVKSPSPSYFRISLEFSNTSDGSGYFFTPFVIDSLIFDYDYTGNCYDSILATITLSPKDYALLQDQAQNIQCLLVMSYTNNNGTDYFQVQPIKKKYHVMLTNPHDVRMSIPDIHLYTTPSHQLTLRLVEDTVYRMRHTSLNVCLHSATVKDAIHAVLHGYDVSNIDLVEPDNTHVWDHIPIPSYMKFSEVFSYFQTAYGVYEKGMCYYLTNGRAYFYPPFETNPKSSRSLTFYQVDTGRYGGSPQLHKRIGNDYQIVINTQPHALDLSVVGSENHGTGFTFTRASRATDGYTALESTGVKYTEDPTLLMELSSGQTMVKNMAHTRHVISTDNPYPHLSELAFQQASLMTVAWPHGDPFALIPGEKVTYCYDYNGTMIKRTGIVERGQFIVRPLKRDKDKHIYGTDGHLILRLAPVTRHVYS